MGEHRSSTKLIAVTLGVAAFGAACGDDDGGSGGSVEAWCAQMDLANEVDETFENIESFDAAGLETAMNQAGDAVPRFEAAAPPEIADDMKVLGDYTGTLIDALGAADYNLFDVDLAAVASPETQALVDEASSNLDEFSERECGQPFGGADEDGGDVGGDVGFDPGAGTIREQLVQQFVAIGLTQGEAECMASNVDPTNDAVLSGDQEAILALFEACGIPLSRLAELGG